MKKTLILGLALSIVSAFSTPVMASNAINNTELQYTSIQTLTAEEVISSGKVTIQPYQAVQIKASYLDTAFFEVEAFDIHNVNDLEIRVEAVNDIGVARTIYNKIHYDIGSGEDKFQFRHRDGRLRYVFTVGNVGPQSSTLKTTIKEIKDKI